MGGRNSYGRNRRVVSVHPSQPIYEQRSQSTTSTFAPEEEFTTRPKQMLNALCWHWHIDGRPCPIVERSMSADNVDFIMMQGTLTTHNSSGMLWSRHDTDSCGTIPSKRATEVIIAFIPWCRGRPYWQILRCQMASGIWHLRMDVTVALSATKWGKLEPCRQNFASITSCYPPWWIEGFCRMW